MMRNMPLFKIKKRFQSNLKTFILTEKISIDYYGALLTIHHCSRDETEHNMLEYW